MKNVVQPQVVLAPMVNGLLLLPESVRLLINANTGRVSSNQLEPAIVAHMESRQVASGCFVVAP